MKKSEILQMARGMILRKTKSTICAALSGVAMLNPATGYQVIQLKSWIKEMLGRCDLYEEWLITWHQPFLQQHDLHVFISTLQAWNHDVGRTGRLQWIDWMIEIHRKQEAEEEAAQHLNRFNSKPDKPIPF